MYLGGEGLMSPSEELYLALFLAFPSTTMILDLRVYCLKGLKTEIRTLPLSWRKGIKRNTHLKKLRRKEVTEVTWTIR